MAGAADVAGGRGGNGWRIAGWSAAVLLLLTPLVAMQFTDEVQWTAGDFVFAAVLILAVGIPLELAVRKSGDASYRAGAVVALAGAFLLVWVNGAVGIIGSENNDANLMYLGVLAIGVLGVLLARFRARGMAWALAATALATGIVAAIALVLGLGGAESGPAEVAAVNGFFVTLFAASAILFRNAADGSTRSAAI